ncbi:Hypothetical predicted protein [Podarcis lilfordi]|uniref:Uncharacterized protein n=1 Tax=Podarcis lilfordi TaxID=74358 RepID=A0AA35KBQ4_9SAUR|nr:Hypothetical predicted protein [Podarcis lilfordi]
MRHLPRKESFLLPLWTTGETDDPFMKEMEKSEPSQGIDGGRERGRDILKACCHVSSDSSTGCPTVISHKAKERSA